MNYMKLETENAAVGPFRAKCSNVCSSRSTAGSVNICSPTQFLLNKLHLPKCNQVAVIQ